VHDASMTTVAEVPLATPPHAVRPGDVLVALGLIAAELVLGWFTYDIARELQVRAGLSRPVVWFYQMMPFLLLALVVAVHAIRPGRALGAALAALAGGALLIAHSELVRWIYQDHRINPSYHQMEAIGYVVAMGVATTAALAWGLSRRHGLRWPLGLLVAPAGAALTLWTDWTSRLAWARFDNPFDTASVRRAEIVHTVALMIPVVAACVVCWLIDAAQERRTTTGPTYDDGPPSR